MPSLSSGRPPLRVGLLLDAPQLPQYLVAVVRRIQASTSARTELVIVTPSPRRARRRPLLFRLYQRWDRRHLPVRDNPLTPVVWDVDLPTVPVVAARTVGEPDVIHQVREARLDVLLDWRVDESPLPSGLARFGAWRLQHGPTGGAEYFWEVRRGEPVSAVALQVTGAAASAPDAGPIRIAQAALPTRSGISQVANTWRPCWASVSLVTETLDAVHRTAALPSVTTAAAALPLATTREVPGNVEMAAWLAPALGAKAVRRLRTGRAPVAHWKIGVRRGGPSLLDGGDRARGWQWLASPPGRFYADPFLLARAGATWLFFEDYEYALGRARLSCAVLDPAGGLGPVRPILEAPFHLSYPCVFDAEGELFLVPETREAGCVALYRCRRFPDRWEQVSVLFRAPAVDTTVWRQDGLYWFLTTVVDPHTAAGSLHLFSAPAVDGPWTPHPGNPLSRDVRNCRGAGAMVRHDGRWFRPSQDGSRAYGYSFTLNELVQCDRGTYRERPAVTVDPGIARGLSGVHTYARLGDLEVIDACELVSPGDARVVARSDPAPALTPGAPAA